MSRTPLTKCVVYLCAVICFMPFVLNCAGEESKTDNTEDEALNDPYAELRASVPLHGIRCNETACCWDDCQYDQVLCGQQNGKYAAVDSTLDNFDLDQTPDWWRSYRFYLISDYEINYLSGRTDRQKPTYFYVGAYCHSESYHTAYTFLTVFDGHSDFEDYLQEGVPEYTCKSALKYCDGFCKPDCIGRECGSDGCGGTCGTCSNNEPCNSQGECVSSQNDANACDNCLSVCRGLPGCCEGCGCMCEDECGGCI